MDGKLTQPGYWGAGVFLLVCIVVGIFDFVALYSDGRVKTVSSVIQELTKEYPLIAVIFGVIIGHLFFPTRPPQ